MGKDNIIGIRLSEEEQLIHDWLTDFFGFRGIHGEASQTFKQAEIVAYNVLHGLFGDNLKDIFAREAKEQLKERRARQTQKVEPEVKQIMVNLKEIVKRAETLGLF